MNSRFHFGINKTSSDIWEELAELYYIHLGNFYIIQFLACL